MDLADLNAMDADALRILLSGPPEQVAAALRAAAEGGVVEAQLRLGQMLLEGHGVPASPREALRWFAAAAKGGDPMAMNMVGRCTEHGWGAVADKALAARWYEAAAEHGLDWGMYNLATLLSLGDGVEQDLARALDLFRRAAALGHAKSMNMIGSFYEDGWVVPADRAAAADQYRRAAEGGDFRGQFNHARLLVAEGRLSEAIGWIGKAKAGGTLRFRNQVDGWLRGQTDPRLRGLASGEGGSEQAQSVGAFGPSA